LKRKRILNKVTTRQIKKRAIPLSHHKMENTMMTVTSINNVKWRRGPPFVARYMVSGTRKIPLKLLMFENLPKSWRN
jgi:hypothetical protein